MGGKGKGGAKAAYLPPARSRAPSGDDAGPTITEKIKQRKAAGGAEDWDAFKARVKHQQMEAAASENHEVLLSAQHRERVHVHDDGHGFAEPRRGFGSDDGFAPHRARDPQRRLNQRLCPEVADGGEHQRAHREKRDAGLFPGQDAQDLFQHGRDVAGGGGDEGRAGSDAANAARQPRRRAVAQDFSPGESNGLH